MAEREGKTSSDRFSLHIGRPRDSLSPSFSEFHCPSHCVRAANNGASARSCCNSGRISYLTYLHPYGISFVFDRRRVGWHFASPYLFPSFSFPLAAFQSARIVAAVIAYMLTHNLMHYRLICSPSVYVCYNRNVSRANGGKMKIMRELCIYLPRQRRGIVVY